MKIQITVQAEGNEITWTEDYDVLEVKTLADAEEWGRNLIARYNDGLRPKERRRYFIGAKLDAGDGLLKHDWQKQNSFTQIDRGLNFDVMKCRACGMTGRRYGISETTTHDREWRAKKYRICPGQPITKPVKKGVGS